MDTIRVEAPASSANLGPGFDVFALALESPRDSVSLRHEPGGSKVSVRIGRVTGLDVPRSADENGACIVCKEMSTRFEVRGNVTVDLDKRVPIGMGLGSSGASAAGAAVAMNELLGLGLSQDELIFHAGKGEGATSGARHYDNVAASILGGFVVVGAGAKGKPTASRFDPPEDMAVCVATPVVELPKRKTEYARSLLPRSVPFDSLVANVANASLMVAGFAKRDIKLIGKGMTDKVVDKARKSMIPGYDRVRSEAIGAGAEGVCISGAGPSLLAVVDRERVEPKRVLEAIIASFAKEGAESSGYVTKVGGGARVAKNR